MLTDTQMRVLAEIASGRSWIEYAADGDRYACEVLRTHGLVTSSTDRDGARWWVSESGCLVLEQSALLVAQGRRIRELEMRLSLKDAQTALRKAESDHHCAGDRRDWDEITRTEVELRMAEVAHSKAVTALQKEGHEP